MEMGPWPGSGVGCREDQSWRRAVRVERGAYLVIAGRSMREDGESPCWLVF